MISTEEKYEYLLRKWRYVNITRDFEIAPVFDLNGQQIPGMVENVPIDSFCCSNYSLKKRSFFGIPKTFHGSSAQETIDLAYKSERIGEQLNLFTEV